MPLDRRRPTRKRLRPGPEVCHPRVGKTRPSSGCFPIQIRRRLTQRGHSTKGGKICKDMSNDRCMLESSSLTGVEKEALAKTYLRPKRPSEWASDPDQWLDSNNIADVMKQYEEAYKDFKFLGVLSIDFAAPDPYNKSNGEKCLVNSICEMKLSDLKKSGINRLGAVINLDPHFKSGSHWVGLFIDLRANIKKVYYFDSYGIKPPQQIAILMRSLTLQDPKLTLEYNARRFQYEGSECGMYSLYFIITMLDGGNFAELCHNPIPDKEMLNFRHWIFS